MLGDDLNATMMTERYGFGAVSDTREGSMLCAKSGRLGLGCVGEVLG